jgi:hypothetical protein
MIGQRLNIAEVAELLLNGVVAHYAASADPEVEALPARRLVLAGDAATLSWDCEQLTITTQGVVFGAADDAAPTTPMLGTPASVMSVRSVPFEVSLVRCLDVGNVEEGGKPSDPTLYSEGMRFMRDVGLISQALVEIGVNLRSQLGPGGLVRAGQVLPAGPEGGFVAAVGLFTVSTTRLT